jgi:hypothetical protein
MEKKAKNPVLCVFKKDFAKLKRLRNRISEARSEMFKLHQDLPHNISEEILARDMDIAVRSLLLCSCKDIDDKEKPLIEILIKRKLGFINCNNYIDGYYGLRLSRLIGISKQFGSYDYKVILEKLNDSFDEVKFTYYFRKTIICISIEFK